MSIEPEDRPLLKPREAAELLGMNERTLANWRVKGEGPPFYKIGGAVRYDRAAVIKWRDGRKRGETSDVGE